MKKTIKDYLDASYLKTAAQAGISIEENDSLVNDLLEDALIEKYKLVMVLPDQVQKAKSFLISHKSNVLVGTVIDFPFGNGGLELKLAEAKEAITNGADDLDFVIDYNAFKKGLLDQIQNEIKQCTALVLEHGKTIKWIIETAALNDTQIIKLTVFIKNTVLRYFKESEYQQVFIKSSTGFYLTENNLPNGATPHVITLMLENATPLPVKASGGIRNYEDALFYIQKGVKRLGTSSQKEIVTTEKS